jgi:hypothetical protein
VVKVCKVQDQWEKLGHRFKLRPKHVSVIWIGACNGLEYVSSE